MIELPGLDVGVHIDDTTLFCMLHVMLTMNSYVIDKMFEVVSMGYATFHISAEGYTAIMTFLFVLF